MVAVAWRVGWQEAGLAAQTAAVATSGVGWAGGQADWAAGKREALTEV